MHDAVYFKELDNGVVECLLCPQHCIIRPESWGKCGARFNQGGRLYSWYYGKISALHSDPIEKKPLYHFMPGRQILSVGSYGCNLDCSFCQNHPISQGAFGKGDHYSFSPEELTEKALHIPNNTGIAFTYNEPTVGFEFVLETARLAKQKGLNTVLVSNGYINQAPLDGLLDVMDAFNIDLKAFNEGFYRKVTSGSLQPVLNTIKRIIHRKAHLEITHLVIPGMNDDREDFREMTQWIQNEAGKHTPFHLSRFFPHYRLLLEPTPRVTLKELYEIAAKQLSFVYPGNITLHEAAAHTWCPQCESLVIRREGYSAIIENADEKGCCLVCGTSVFRN